MFPEIYSFIGLLNKLLGKSMKTLPIHELQENFHQLMREPKTWKVIKYEFEVNYETGLLDLIFLTFKSETGDLKKLKFNEPRMADYSHLQIPSSCNLYIADIRSLGWNAKIEVGEYDDEISSLFWASSVEEVV